jgi:hypothetical protein
LVKIILSADVGLLETDGWIRWHEYCPEQLRVGEIHLVTSWKYLKVNFTWKASNARQINDEFWMWKRLGYREAARRRGLGYDYPGNDERLP